MFLEEYSGEWGYVDEVSIVTTLSIDSWWVILGT